MCFEYCTYLKLFSKFQATNDEMNSEQLDIYLKAEPQEMISVLSCLKSWTLLQDSLANWQEFKEYFDLELRCEGKVIFCHKLVMSLSPLILKCLKDLTDDTDIAVIILDGFEYGVVEVMVNNMYSSLSRETSMDFQCDMSLAKELQLSKLSLDNENSKIQCLHNMKKEDKQLESANFIAITNTGCFQVKDEGDLKETYEEDVFEADFNGVTRDQHGLRDLKKYPVFNANLLKPVLPIKVKKFKRIKKIYNCSGCPAQFKFRKDRDEHFRVDHPLVGPVCCRVCKRTLSEARIMYKHLKICSKTYICEDCGHVCDSKKRYQQHVSSWHTIAKCKICLETFVGRQKLKVHETSLHKQIVTCELCGKVLTSRTIRHHMLRVHTPSHLKPIKCEHCGKGLATRGQYIQHVAEAHTNEKPFKCKFHCGKPFNSTSNRAKHEKIHKRELCLDKETSKDKGPFDIPI